ncbi:hypothetical protein XELAEV_18007508mg [Xenopus laevis]|uniref:Uncharacterized protein n=1 Tax=Xenopus laevis TaxID=8355 RepID=A0A974I5G4_XENLA|nr:hypothetical protein XELAEV_18007508mg [Xenopus laevis]
MEIRLLKSGRRLTDKISHLFFFSLRAKLKHKGRSWVFDQRTYAWWLPSLQMWEDLPKSEFTLASSSFIMHKLGRLFELDMMNHDEHFFTELLNIILPTLFYNG